MDFSRIRRLVRKEDGSATVETVLWIPVFAFLLFLMADAAIIFGGEARILRVVQDANRSLSIGRFRTPEETEAFILQQIGGLTANATAETTVTDGLIVSRVILPASDLSATQLIPAFAGLQLSIVAEHLSEA